MKRVPPFIPASFCLAIFLYEGVVYNYVFLFGILPDLQKDFLIPIFGVIFNVLWGLAVTTYLRAHCSDPGRVPQRWLDFMRREGQNVRTGPAERAWQPGLATFCKRSGFMRPERAHYCSASQQCVMRMDHYCPWTGNCVGFLNYKFFLLLGIYVCLSSMFALITAFPELLACATGHTPLGGLVTGESGEGSEWRYFAWGGDFEGALFLGFGVVTVAVFALLCTMLNNHIPLALQNMTSIEEMYDNMPNPYDHEDWYDNLTQVMGRFGMDWFFPILPCKPVSDGVSFPRPGEELPPGLRGYGSDSEHSDSEDDVGHSPEDLWRYRYRTGPVQYQVYE